MANCIVNFFIPAIHIRDLVSILQFGEKVWDGITCWIGKIPGIESDNKYFHVQKELSIKGIVKTNSYCQKKLYVIPPPPDNVKKDSAPIAIA